MSHLDPLFERNPQLAATGAHAGLSPMPTRQVCIVSCMDSRTDPAHYLGAEPGEALVVRNAGGRVTAGVIDEVAFIAAAAELMFGDDAPGFEVAVVHHTACGTGLLADEGFRRSFAERIGRTDDSEFTERAVIDPAVTVAADVELLRASPLVPARVTASGHVYDVETGLLTTIVPAG